MLKTWKAHLTGAALVAVMGTVGCYDFGDARERCEQEGRCGAQPDGGLPDGGRPDGGGECTFVSNEDPPDDDFRDTNCDGVDGIAATGLFVDPENGDDANMGTLASPVRTITRAVALLQNNGRPGITALYLARGTYNEANLVVNVPVSLYGGYAGRGNWQRDGTHVTHLDGGQVGMMVQNLGDDAGVILDRLSLTSATATAAGAPSIALQITNSRGVVMRYSTIAAGQGAVGSRGNDGLGGADGGSGDAGTTAQDSTAGSGGAPGVSLCQGVDHSGGAGRNGTTETGGVPGFPGKPSGVGGGGGSGGLVGTITQPAANEYDCTAGPGDAGTPGTWGDAGVAGESGMGMGALIGNTWVATTGGNGTPGRNGSGGGSGGSGGACPTEPNNNLAGAAGSGSGGGGGGGCGGGAGGGGGGGGASIAVLLVGSDVRFEGTTVLRTAGGGRGGEGGAGGPGGVGGQGGAGAPRDFFANTVGPNTYVSRGGAGGTGGNGGNGGNGGPGGGGGGGPSVGVWCGPNSGYTGSVQDQLGLAGQGGPGGTGGNAGANGLKALSHNCPPPP
jgi:hypothetical protein